MIIVFILECITTFLAILFGWLGTVDRLPVVLGYDIDTTLLTGVGYITGLFSTYWPLYYVMGGFAILTTYYLIKMIIIAWLGHRMPKG